MANPLYLRSGGGNWNATTTWSETDGGDAAARIPDSATDVYCTAASGSATLSIVSNPDYCRSFICTGFSGTLTGASGKILSVNGTVFVLSATMTVGTAFSIWMKSSSGGTINTAGKAVGPFAGAYGAGTFSLLSDLTCNGLYILNGTFSANTYNVSSTFYALSGSATRGISMGSGTWTASGDGSAFTIWDLTDTTGLTFDAGTSLLRFTGSLAAARTCRMGALTYYNVRNSTSGNNYLIFRDTSTYNTLTVDPGSRQGFYRGQTFTIATPVFTGTAGSGIYLSSDTTSAATIAKSGGGTVTIQYATITYLTGSPANTFYAYNSTSGGNNTTIYFTKGLTGTANLDAILRAFRTIYGTTALDALLVFARSGTVSLDVLLAATRTGSTYLDAILGSGRTGLFYLDTYLETPFSGPVGAYDKILAYRTLYISGSGLSGTDGRFRFVKCGAKKDTVVLAAPGDVPLGVNYGIGLNKTKIQVPCAGIVKLRLAGKVKRGNMLKVCSDLNDGRAVASTNTRAYGAMALQNGESGEIISALLLQGHGS